MRRNLRIAMLLTAIVVIALVGCSRSSSPKTPVQSPPIPVQPTQQPAQPPVAETGTKQPSTAPQPVRLDLPGNMADLQAALAQPSRVTYQIEIVQETGITDRTAHLDFVLASRNWPEQDMLVILLFPADNYDIRVAMGSIFQAHTFSVDEMLTTIRTVYLPAARENDPARGLAEVIRTINLRLR
jgi:hypothetical protein